MKLVIATVLALTYLFAPAASVAKEKPKPVVTKPSPTGPAPNVCDYPVFRCGKHSGG